MNLEDCIKDLTPELQERARACGGVEELLALAKENAIPVPDEALCAVAGGVDAEGVSCGNIYKCPKCGHKQEPYKTKDLGGDAKRFYFLCNYCGNTWYRDVKEFPPIG